MNRRSECVSDERLAEVKARVFADLRAMCRAEGAGEPPPRSGCGLVMQTDLLVLLDELAERRAREAASTVEWAARDESGVLFERVDREDALRLARMSDVPVRRLVGPWEPVADEKEEER